MGATIRKQNFHHTRSCCFTNITSGTRTVRSEGEPTNARVCLPVRGRTAVHVRWQWREGVTPRCMGHGLVGTHALRLWVKMLVVFLTSMHNDPFLYIIKYIYIFICIMLLCKEKKTSYIALENYVYTVLFRTSSYRVPMYHWCFPLFFLHPSPPPKTLIKSNQTFRIIERIYTAPYLLFIIIIINNYYSFYKRKILEAKYIKLPCLSV